MKYREARLLKEGEEVYRLQDNLPLIVCEVMSFGQHKTVQIICYLKNDQQKHKLYYYNFDLI